MALYFAGRALTKINTIYEMDGKQAAWDFLIQLKEEHPDVEHDMPAVAAKIK